MRTTAVGNNARAHAVRGSCTGDRYPGLGIASHAGNNGAVVESHHDRRPSGTKARTGLPTGTVTFLFTDIEGSTRLLGALGERYGPLLEAHNRILRDAIADHGGTEVNTEGDAFFAVFPSAVDAVAATVDAQQAIAAADWPDGAPLRVRMGLHTGEGRLGGDNYLGIDVHRAARIAAAAHGGQVLLSEATRSLVVGARPPGVGIRELGRHRLRDLEDPIGIAQLEIEGLPSDFPPPRTPEARLGNLPEPLTTFVGREQDLSVLLDLVTRHRLVTLTGPGGTGKTRLALHAAHELRAEFPDGAYFVDLAPIRDPAFVALAVAQALGVAADPGGDPARALASHLRDRQLLLLLDNFEQVVAAASLVNELLSASQALRILVTSRTPLGAQGEQELPVPPLDVAPDDAPLEELRARPAVRLFVDRARAVALTFDLTDETAPLVVRIVRHLDGLPLAIELAASQTRLLPPAALAARLDQHLALPSLGAGDRPERQRTIDAAIAWSYALLEPAQRRLFARLAVFPGGCSLAAAERVCDAGDLDEPVLDGLAALVSHSLVRQLAAPTDPEPRFGMLETILDYAAGRLRDEFDAEATHRRLAEFLVGFAEEAEPHLTRTDQLLWLDRCEQERANLRGALRWTVEAGEASLGLRLATALWRFWHQRGPIWEGRQVLDELLALPGASDRVRARALGAAGGLAWWSGDYPTMRRCFEEALPLAKRSGDDRILMDALYDIGFALLWGAVLAGGIEVERVEQAFAQSQALAEELDDRRGVGRALRGSGMALGIARGDAIGALPILQRATGLLEEAGERWDLIEAIVAVSNAYRFSGHPEEAKPELLRAIDLSVEGKNRSNTVGLLLLLTPLESDVGHHDRVVRLWAGAQAAHEAAGATRPPSAQRLIGDPVGAARQAIGDQAVEKGLAEGRQMSFEDLLAYAHG
jgi:predicted ATPase/class 3 adenylate cyclase